MARAMRDAANGLRAQSQPRTSAAKALAPLSELSGDGHSPNSTGS